MNQADRDHIRQNYIELGDAITPIILEILDYLFQKGTINKYMKDAIVESADPNHRKARKLLDLIPTRGPRAFQELYNGCIQHHLFDAADILKPQNAPHEQKQIDATTNVDEYESPDEALPDSWPADDTFGVLKNARNVERRHTKMKALFNKTATPEGRDVIYVMSAKPRGQVLVINNEVFTVPNLKKRDGTIEDRKALETIFRALDFEIVVKKDRTKEDMWNLLVEESNRESHSQANCFALFILSHGHNGMVFGADGLGIEIKKIVDLFSQSRKLQGKPKLLFIQACQGGSKNKGEPIDSADSSDTPNTRSATSGNVPSGVDDDGLHDQTDGKKIVGGAVPETRYNQPDLKTIIGDILPTTESDSSGDKRPSGADIHLALSTLPGYLSWRNQNKGTWFIQAVAYVFAKYAYKYNLGQLMNRVSNLVGKAETEGGDKQQIETRSTLTKDFYFFPGLFEGK